MKRLPIALYGENGHQLAALLRKMPEIRADIVAVCAYTRADVPGGCARYDTLDALLADRRVALVSLCSPIRAEQAGEAIRCMRAGKHVYAEKPCALTEDALDALIRTSAETGTLFHEMAGTAFVQPYWGLRTLVQSGALGEVTEVFAQKSYPLNPGDRPQDECVDGGMLRQAGVHVLRFVEHITGLRITDISARQTRLGNPYERGGLHTAAALTMTLSNGAVAGGVVNYLNPHGFGLHGYDVVRVWGTEGFAETTDGGRASRVIVGREKIGEVETASAQKDYFERYVDALLEGVPMPVSLADELHPTRMILRAAARAGQAPCDA